MRAGAAGGLLVAALLVLAAALLTVVWVIGGISTVVDVVHALGTDALGGTVLAVAELAYLPDLVVWNLAWVAGPGFAVGAGTRFAPGGTVEGPMPAVPFLGALPTPDLAGRAGLLSALLLLAIGALGGWYLHRRLQVRRPADVLTAVGVLAAVAGGLCAALVRAASGGIGPGRMAEVGGVGWQVGSCVAAGALLGAALLALPAEPAVRAAVADFARRLRASATAPGGSAAGVAYGGAPAAAPDGGTHDEAPHDEAPHDEAPHDEQPVDGEPGDERSADGEEQPADDEPADQQPGDQVPGDEGSGADGTPTAPVPAQRSTRD